ncbi:PAS domain-containing protein [uncultured Helicobacter sp.]|uniref:PAS domain-containing protein n=1 Tax=uncultured Helicobacter sp. TaxID=175537 RepID=UPI001C3BF8AB|nr:PAS domain-containing protein [Candidatus Helicobacter avicola]
MELFLQDDTLITSKTDTKGKITYGNEDFCYFGGFKDEKEFINKPHNLIRHESMPRVAFKLLWDTVKGGEEFFGFACNRSAQGNTYWVFANITPSYDAQGNIVGYYSVRRRASKAGVEALSAIYKKCLELETSQSVQAAQDYIAEILKKHNKTWNELMISLQAEGKTGGYR